MEFLLLIIGVVAVFWFFGRDTVKSESDKKIHDGVIPVKPSVNISVATRTVFFPSGISPRIASHESLVQKAIDEGRDISFRYVDKSGEVSNRRMTPRVIKPYYFETGLGSSTCVEGFCHHREANRVFALKRMSNLSVN